VKREKKPKNLLGKKKREAVGGGGGIHSAIQNVGLPMEFGVAQKAFGCEGEDLGVRAHCWGESQIQEGERGGGLPNKA